MTEKRDFDVEETLVDNVEEELQDIASQNDSTVKNNDGISSVEVQELLDKISAKEKESEEYLDLARRTKAEFENFRKRTQKEKESLYDDGFSDAVKNVLPILDNLERAVSFNTSEKSSFSEGVEMVLKMFKDSLSKMGIEEIEAVGKKFDPDFHNAVMHIEDEALEENVIVEVLQKGYKFKNKVIRYSMVKVAN